MMMAADVTSLIRILNGAEVNESGKSTALITRDLLGGGFTVDSKELDLDLQVPSGWEKRLDLKSGKVYIHKCHSLNSSSSTSDQKKHNNDAVSKLQDLNFPPAAKQSLSLFDDTNLDLKLDDTSLDLKLVPSSSASSASSSSYRSVCTLDKVKFALERAEKETIRKRSISMSKSSSPPSNSSSSIKDTDLDEEEKSLATFAAGCPSCLLYVLISKGNPKCPRCRTIVPLPAPTKKPRIDLNISI